MRGALYFAAAGLVAVSAFWTYRVNYDAQATLARIADVRREIVAEREALVVLQAEWAWLNAPARLERLRQRHAENLGLEPIAGAHYADFADLPTPPPETFWVRADPALLAAFSTITLAAGADRSSTP